MDEWPTDQVSRHNNNCFRRKTTTTSDGLYFRKDFGHSWYWIIEWGSWSWHIGRRCLKGERETWKRLTTGPPNVKCYCRGSWVGFSLKVKAGADYVCDLCLRKDFGYGELLGEEGVAKIFAIVCYFYKRYIKEERETRTCR